MTLYKVFYEILADLADMFDAENRIGGHEAAQELRAICSKSHTPLLPAHQVLNDTIELALSLNPLPIAKKIHKIMPLIDWHYSGVDAGATQSQLKKHIATAELIGPDGMIFNDKLRIGLFAQSANINYVTQDHAAEENFIMLGGSGYWQTDAEPTLKKSGDVIHNPSMTPHVSVTKNEPFIAAWRWSGDIRFEKITLTG